MQFTYLLASLKLQDFIWWDGIQFWFSYTSVKICASKEKKIVAKNKNRSLSFYEEAIEEVLISVRGNQSATRSDVSAQEVLQQSSVPISGATATPTENQLQSEAEA